MWYNIQQGAKIVKECVLMKRAFSCFLSVASVFSSCFITKAETLDMRYITNDYVKKQIKEKAKPDDPCFASLLRYISKLKRPEIRDIKIADKIAMTIDDFLKEVCFTSFFINQEDKVIGSAIITYKFKKDEEKLSDLYLYALTGDLLSHLEFCETQYSLNQSEKTSIEELTDPGQIYTISLEDFLAAIKPTITDTNSVEIKQQLSELKFDIQSYRITEDDYKAEEKECEEEDKD